MWKRLESYKIVACFSTSAKIRVPPSLNSKRRPRPCETKQAPRSVRRFSSNCQASRSWILIPTTSSYVAVTIPKRFFPVGSSRSYG
ncbi:hypothetical protein WN55_04444 [Dufourea novaeangliae]|uniref:Uncharacterized protein n=1 Tax=Dufourea novaeangliae TaxID=178035 RepID=A0A154PM21_DUFNO|nr:hypothetical protein WN55_04444 [Dufourea novaeangliae]